MAYPTHPHQPEYNYYLPCTNISLGTKATYPTHQPGYNSGLSHTPSSAWVKKSTYPTHPHQPGYKIYLPHTPPSAWVQHLTTPYTPISLGTMSTYPTNPHQPGYNNYQPHTQPPPGYNIYLPHTPPSTWVKQLPTLHKPIALGTTSTYPTNLLQFGTMSTYPTHPHQPEYNIYLPHTTPFPWVQHLQTTHTPHQPRYNS